ncbi:MAG: hypothetical protein F6K11_03875 [Leptolyngbya sp. SIO3F4]|nr:hypothetical protein [Leptolyngbya sp. SIO3F4]
MIKPSDKVLIGWLTLLATFASTNLGRASASDMPAGTEQSTNDNVAADLSITEQSDVAESADAAIEANAQGIVPESDGQQPEFSSQPVSQEVQFEGGESEVETVVAMPVAIEPVASLSPNNSATRLEPLVAKANRSTNDSAAKLEHLVATATQSLSDTEVVNQAEVVDRSEDKSAKLEHLVSTASHSTNDSVAKLEHLTATVTQSLSDSETIDSEDRAAKLKHLVATATRDFPSASSLANVTAEALPSTRVIIPPDSPVAETVAEPDAAIETGNSMAVSEDRLVKETQSSVASSGETIQRTQVQDTLAATASVSETMPDEAIPTSVVYSPRSLDHTASAATTNSEFAKQELPGGSNLAQTSVPDSSGSVGDSFSPENLTDEELRQLLSVETPFFPPPVPAPASSFGTPTAYGADEGDAFIGIAGVGDGDQSDTDGSLSLGVGAGDAVSSVGVELNVGIISLDGFGDDGQIGFKIHKIIPEADNLAVAIGWSNPITWGAADDAEETIYGVVTQRFDLQPNNKSNSLPLTVSAGVGTGSFRSKGAIKAGDNPPNFFGSVGLRVIPEMSVVSSWTGSALNLGVSAAPFDFPLVFSAGAADVTSNTRDGARFAASVGYGFKF